MTRLRAMQSLKKSGNFMAIDFDGLGQKRYEVHDARIAAP
jgi:hypothetical protein